MLESVESGQEDFLFVDGRIEFAVAVHIGVDGQIRGLRYDDFVFESGNAQRGLKGGVLDEDGGSVGFAAAGGVFKNDNAVAFGAALGFASVVDAFCHPEAAFFIKVNVGGIEQARGGRPDGHLESFGH